MLAFGLLLLVGTSISWSEAFNIKAVEGVYYMQRYNATTPIYRDSTCHRQSANWFNGTTIEATYHYKLTSGEQVDEKYTVLLQVKPKVHFQVMIDDKGQLKHHCFIQEVKFGKSGNTAKTSSDCYFAGYCGSRNKVPTEAEIAELNELCPAPEYKPHSQENC